MEVYNATIEDTKLDIGDRGLLQGWIFLNLSSGGSQGFGGLALYLPKSYKYHKIQSTAGHWIFRICEIAGVDSWEKLKGKTIRVAKNGSSDPIMGIGHIIKDDWFYPSTDFKDLKD